MKELVKKKLEENHETVKQRDADIEKLTADLGKKSEEYEKINQQKLKSYSGIM